jgi:hypothetical protein
VQSPFHPRFLKYFLCPAVLLVLAGCVRLRPATVPLRTVSYPGNGQPRTLVALLPGRRGRSDDFARANGMAAEVLPPERVFTAPGGHDWKAWRSLWEQFVRTGALSSPQPGYNPPP